MAGKELITPTPFMKSLDQTTYDSIIADAKKRMEVAVEGYAKLIKAIGKNKDGRKT